MFVSNVDENWVWNKHVLYVPGNGSCRIEIMTSMATFCQYHIDLKCKDGLCLRSVVCPVQMGIHKFDPYVKLHTWLFSIAATSKEKINLKTVKKYQSFRMILMNHFNIIIHDWIENIPLFPYCFSDMHGLSSNCSPCPAPVRLKWVAEYCN